MLRGRFAFVFGVVSLLAVACSSSTPKHALSDGCTLNSDCANTLVCTFGRCHAACEATKDCPSGQSCIKASDGTKVCQLPVEQNCLTGGNCATPLTCGADGKCRGQCTSNSDCTTGQKCTTSGNCAEPAQVDASNNLIVSNGSGGTSGVGGTTSSGTNIGGSIAVGGVSSSGGATNTGGTVSGGGTSNAGGTLSVGGSAAGGGGANSGGTNATGGTTAAAGATNMGGSTSTGGTTATGGTKATGGTPSTGGTTNLGGTTSTGGSTNAKLVAKAITAGGDHTCVLLSDSSVRCWGDNTYGELGNGTTTNSLIPVTVGGVSGGVSASITTASAVAAGRVHTCVLLSDGSVRCWGDNTYGELGNGTTTTSSVPVTVPGITNATAVTAGGDDAVTSGYSCAVLNSGMIQCWGDNNFGELGNGAANAAAFTVPETVVGITSAIGVASGDGDSNTCALVNGATGINVWCWGSNGDGQLGNGSSGYSTSSSVPMLVSGITDAVAVAAGGIYGNLDNHICAVLSDGTVRCWGYNADGELGNGTTVNSSVPVTVPGITNAVAVAAGSIHTCAVLSSGTVQCWGNKEDGTTTNSLVPVPISGITNAIAVAAGGSHTCAVLSGGSVQCWGLNSTGQLGTGNKTNSWLPVTVYGF